MGNRDSERRYGQGRLRLSGLSGLSLSRLGGLGRRDVVEFELGLGAVHRSDRGRFFAVGGDVVAIVGVELVACHHFILQRVASGNCTGFSGATTATAAATTTTAATTTARAFACGFATGSSRARFDRGRCTRFLRSGGHGVGSDRRGTGDGDRGRDIHQFRRCGNGSGFRLDGLLPGLLRLGLLLFAGRARGLRLRAFLGLLARRVLLRLLLLLLLLGLLLLLLLGLLLLLLWLGTALVATLLVATAVASLLGIAAIATLAIAAFIATLAAAIAATLLRTALCGALGPRRFNRDRLAAAEETEDALDDADRLHGCSHRRRSCNHCRNRRLARFTRFAQRCGRGRPDVGDDRQVGDVEVGLGQRMRRQLARGAAVVAGLARLFAEFVFADAGDFVVRRVQLLVGNDHDRRVVALLDLAQCAALFVEQVIGDLGRSLHQHLAGVLLHRVLFGQAQDRQRQRFHAAHAAMALAARAYDLAGFAQRRPQALARHLHQAEARDAAELDAGTILLEGVLQAVLDLALVLVRGHVDEVDHHQAAEVAQAQLAGGFFGRFQVGVERGFLDVAALGGARRVDVDRGQGFGLVNHERAAGGQAHFAFVRVLDLGFDLEAVEERRVVGVMLQLALVVRHHLLDELAGLGVHLRRVDEDLADVRTHVVAQRADDQA